MTSLKDKTVLCFDYGNYIEAAQVLGESFAICYYYCPYIINGFPEHEPYDVGRNVPGIIKITEWASVIHTVDMVFFCDCYEAELQLYFESLGIPVFGARKGIELENNRMLLKKVLEEVGLPVNHYDVAIGLKELESILQNKKDVFVKSNMRGDGETWKHTDMRLTKYRLEDMASELNVYKAQPEYVVDEALDSIGEIGVDTPVVLGAYPRIVGTGIEVKDTLYCGRLMKYNDLPRPLKMVTDKLAPVFARYGYKGWFSNEVIITKDLKGYLLDATCFSHDTQVLTNEGWKYFYELHGNEKVCTLNPRNNNIEYHVPYASICYHYEGEMVSISNDTKGIECLVTPNHSVWRTDRHGNGLFEERADSLTDKGYIPRTGIWVGKDAEYFELPEYHHEWDFWGGNHRQDRTHFVCTKVKHENAKKIKISHWVAFLAWYLSEGSLGGQKNSKNTKAHVVIYQSKHPQVVFDVLTSCGFEFSYRKDRFQINSVQLSQYLKKYGLCDRKFVPNYIKELPPDKIRIFLDNYLLGDGSSEKLKGGVRKKYFSTSYQMASDIQELIMKVGGVGNIRTAKIKGTPAKGLKSKKTGKDYIRNHDIHIIEENIKKKKLWFEASNGRRDRYVNRVPYSGLVYDVTVKNHILYVRRNGKPFFSGNCRLPAPPISLFCEMITNFAEVAWSVANGIVPELEYDYSWGVEIIIKSDRAEHKPSPVIVPFEFQNRVKMRNLVVEENGTWVYIPNKVREAREIGSVIGYGRSLYEAMDSAREVGEAIKGIDIKIDCEAMGAAQEQLRALSVAGLKYM